MDATDGYFPVFLGKKLYFVANLPNRCATSGYRCYDVFDEKEIRRT
jgi:hypothetical protein